MRRARDAFDDDPAPWDGEMLVFCADRASGMRAVIAIDDTTLGPALGGVRYRAYRTRCEGAAEARRLATAMTLKNAVAGLPYGGGKAVVFDTGDGAGRDAVLAAFGRAVANLAGRYLPGVDMGTTTADLALMGTQGATVSCAGDDPSPWTALGVAACIRAAVRHADDRDGLDDVHVVVQGAGHVGAALARLLVEDGARVSVADLDGARAAAVARELAVQVVDPGDVLHLPCDVFAPCASAGVLGADAVTRLRCRIIAGAANDQLVDDGVAAQLRDRGILHVPDFVVSAGGVIHIHAEQQGWDTARLEEAVLAIGTRAGKVLDAAAAEGSTPLEVAKRLAADRLAEGAPLTARTSR